MTLNNIGHVRMCNIEDSGCSVMATPSPLVALGSAGYSGVNPGCFDRQEHCSSNQRIGIVWRVISLMDSAQEREAAITV